MNRPDIYVAFSTESKKKYLGSATLPIPGPSPSQAQCWEKATLGQRKNNKKPQTIHIELFILQNI